MKILGIDPGFGRTGWAIIEKNGNILKLQDCGVIETFSKFRKPRSPVKKENLSIIKNSNYSNKLSLSDFKSQNLKSTKVFLKENEGEIPYLLRILELSHQLHLIFQKFSPDEVALEQLFFFKNQKTVIDVAQARGVALITCLENMDGLSHKIFEYTPLQVKSSLTGNGRADKKQVEYMVKQILKLDRSHKLIDDAYDAIAIAITHSMHIPRQNTSLVGIPF